MPQDHHHSHAEMLDRVVEAFDYHPVGDVSRHPHGEYIAKSAVENNLGRRPRIRACQHRGKRMLSLGHFGAPRRRLIGMLQLAGNETLIALEQELEGLLGTDRRFVDCGYHQTCHSDRQRGDRQRHQFSRQDFSISNHRRFSLSVLRSPTPRTSALTRRRHAPVVVRGIQRHRLASHRIGNSEGFPNQGALASYRNCSPQTQKDTFSDDPPACYPRLDISSSSFDDLCIDISCTDRPNCLLAVGGS